MPIEDSPGSVQIRGFFMPWAFKTSDIFSIAPLSK
jgi:hypothetical protein